MPGMSDSAERSVSRRRWPRWKLTAKRCASSRSCCSTNISALFGRIGIASFACGRKTRSGLRRPWPCSRSRAAAAGPARRVGAARPALASRRGGDVAPRRRRSRGDRRALDRLRLAGSASRRPAASAASAASSRSLASPTIGSPTPGRTSMPTSRAAASAIPSWPLPPSTTIRSGSFHAASSSPPSACSRAPEPPRQHLVHRREVVVVRAAPAAGAGARTLYVR